MAIYHFSAKVISRAVGSSADVSAAYRSASRLPDERLGRDHDFSNKAGVVHSEILLPEGAPEHLGDRATLWNAVEEGEVRRDAQLAREVEFAIPREMSEAQGIELARDFVQREFVDQGMVADLNVHRDIDANGLAKPHAHVMLSMREVDESGFGKKVRDWNKIERLQQWREQFDRAMSAVRASPELVPLGKDGHGRERFTSHDMIAVEARLEDAAGELSRARRHRVTEQSRTAALEAAERRGLALSGEQRDAFEHMTGREGLASVVGYAGSGKSAMLGAAREAWEAEGFTVRGAALSGIAAENLEGGSGIAARTLASDAIGAYEQHGMAHVAQTREEARAALIDGWERGRQAAPDARRIILTHTNAEVRELNALARERLRASGELGDNVRFSVERGERDFAAGDRVIFLKNERGLGVKNGTLGTVEELTRQRLSVRLDDGRQVTFDLKDY